MESALRPPLPTATQALAELQIQPWLDQRLRAKHHRTDPRKQTPGGRHQIGTPAGFKSESVAGFLLECVAGFVGIRILSEQTPIISPQHVHVPFHGEISCFIMSNNDFRLSDELSESGKAFR